MPLSLRRAVPADAPVVVEFNRLLARESEGKALDPAVLADPVRGLYFLAEDGGEVVGQTMVTTEWSDWRNGWIWWIQSVYVRPAHRRRGVFRALFEHVHRSARDAGVVGLRLYVERANHVARQTYASMGLGPTGYVVLERCPL